VIAPVGRRESYFVLGSKSGVKTAEKRKKLLKENGYDESQIKIKLYYPKDPAYQPGSDTYIGPGNKGFLDASKQSREGA